MANCELMLELLDVWEATSEYISNIKTNYKTQILTLNKAV